MEADLNSIWFWHTVIRCSPRSRRCCTVIAVPQMTTRTTLTVPSQQLLTDSLTGGDKTHLCPLLLLHSHVSFGKHTCALTLMAFPAWIQLLEAPCGNEAVRFPSLGTQSYGHSVGQVCACWFLRELVHRVWAPCAKLHFQNTSLVLLRVWGILQVQLRGLCCLSSLLKGVPEMHVFPCPQQQPPVQSHCTGTRSCPPSGVTDTPAPQNNL